MTCYLLNGFKMKIYSPLSPASCQQAASKQLRLLAPASEKTLSRNKDEKTRGYLIVLLSELISFEIVL